MITKRMHSSTRPSSVTSAAMVLVFVDDRRLAWPLSVTASISTDNVNIIGTRSGASSLKGFTVSVDVLLYANGPIF